MTCRYDIMKRRAEKYLIPKAKENELSETTTPEIRLNPKNELIQKYQEKYPHLTLDEAELILLSSHFSLELIKHQGFVLHASAISYWVDYITSREIPNWQNRLWSRESAY